MSTMSRKNEVRVALELPLPADDRMEVGEGFGVWVRAAAAMHVEDVHEVVVEVADGHLPAMALVVVVGEIVVEESVEDDFARV